MESTDPVFSALYFTFLILSVFAFNTAGGFSRVAGAYYFWFSMLVVIVGVTTKLAIGEPGESNLLAPTLTMTCYVVTAGMFLLVATILKQFDLRSYEFGAGQRSATLNYTTAGLGCIMVSMANGFAGAILGVAPGGLLSALRQLDQFLPLGIIFATIGAISDSDGRKAFNFVNIFGMAFMFSSGLSTFSKQSLMTPFVCWLVGAMYMRFAAQRVHLVGIAVVAFLCFFVFSPLSQSRDLLATREGDGFIDQITFGITTMVHIQALREHVKSYGDFTPSHSYFGSQQNGLITRLTMIGVDDALINVGNVSEPLGFQPVADDFTNIVPHVLAPNKREPLTGNYYAHEIGGMLADADTGTGISFSPVAETFRGNRWLGLFLILPGVWLMLFSSTEFICGDMRSAPWSLLPILLYAHVAPEGLLVGQIWLLSNGNLATLMAIFFCTRIAPTLGRLFYGSAVSSTKALNTGSLGSQSSQPAPALR